MVKDLSGSIWEINTTNCPAGYGQFECCLGIIQQDGSVYSKNNLETSFGMLGLIVAIGYTREEITTEDGTTTPQLVEKENSIIITTSAFNEHFYTLQTGEKIVFIYSAYDDPFSLFNTKLINYVVNNWTFVNIPNRYYNVVSNNKYIRKINNKNVRRIEVNNKQYNLRPYANLPEYTTISVDRSSSTTEVAINIHVWNFGKTPCEVYKGNELISQIEPLSDLYFTDTALASVITTYEFRGGKINLNVNEAVSCVIGNNYNDIIGFDSGQIITEAPLKSVLTNIDNDRVTIFTCAANMDIAKYPSYVSILSNSYLLSKQANIIPRSVFFIDSGFTLVPATTIMTEITFEHLETDILYLSPFIVPKYKSAQTLTIKHYGNPAVLNYDWASLNITPTFVDLREQQ